MPEKDAFGRAPAVQSMPRSLAVLALVAAVAVGLAAIASALSGGTGPAREPGPRGGSAGAVPAATPPVGLQRRSLLVRRNLAPALHRMRARAGGGRLRSLLVAPDRVDAQVITADRLRAVRARYDGEVAMLSDESAAGTTAASTFAWTDVDPSAPRRMIRRMLGGGSSRVVDHVELRLRAELRWTALLTDATAFSATADGRSVVRGGD